MALEEAEKSSDLPVHGRRVCSGCRARVLQGPFKPALVHATKIEKGDQRASAHSCAAALRF